MFIVAINNNTFSVWVYFNFQLFFKTLFFYSNFRIFKLVSRDILIFKLNCCVKLFLQLFSFQLISVVSMKCSCFLFWPVSYRFSLFNLFITDSRTWPLCPWNPDEGRCFRHQWWRQTRAKWSDCCQLQTGKLCRQSSNIIYCYRGLHSYCIRAWVVWGML